MFNIIFFSEALMVLIMNRLSCVRKKKLPLLPEPSPVLKTCCRFNSGEKEFSSICKLN